MRPWGLTWLITGSCWQHDKPCCRGIGTAPSCPCPSQGTVSPRLSSGNVQPSIFDQSRNQGSSYPKKPFPPQKQQMSLLTAQGCWVRHLAAWQSRQLGTLMVFITVLVPRFYRIHKNHKKEFTLQGGPTVLVSCLMFFQTVTDYCCNSSLVFRTAFLTCV